MTNHSPCNKTAFDVYAADYDVALARGLSVSGEDKSYFARGRIEWLRGCLQPIQESFQTVMDYGCGTGSASDFFFDVLGVDRLIGTDISPKALEIARKEHSSERTQFLLFNQYQPSGQVDLAFCNGVFHHILPNERAAAVDYIYRALRPGGWFSFWENNPWNPGTRYVMSRIPFDRDAITLTPPEARRVLHAGGFEILRPVASRFYAQIFCSYFQGCSVGSAVSNRSSRDYHLVHSIRSFAADRCCPGVSKNAL